MEAKATVKYLRIAPKKVRMVTREVKNMAVSDALNKLKFINKASAVHVAKVIKSAAANASKNFGVDVDKLVIGKIVVEQGPILKYARRFMPRAQGRAAPIQKKSSHIAVVLTDQTVKK